MDPGMTAPHIVMRAPDLLYQETPSRLTCDVDDVTV